MLIIKLLFISFIMYFVVVFLHELGHWLFGSFYGYQFKQLYLGFLLIEKDEGKITYKWNKEISLAPGAIALQLENIDAYSKKGYIMMLLGGPLTTLILMIILLGLLIVYLFGYRMSLGANILYSVVLFIAMSLGIGVVTLFPFKKRQGMYYTDGKRAFELLKNNVCGQNEYNLMYIYQCHFLDVVKKNEIEVSEKITYMLNNPVDNDVLYTILALIFILENQLDILPHKDAVQQIQNLSETTKPLIRKLIHEEMKRYI